MVEGSQRHTSAALPPGKRHGTHCIGGLVGPKADQNGRGKCYCVIASRTLYMVFKISQNAHGTASVTRCKVRVKRKVKGP